MRVLWLCNRALPVVAAELNIDAGNKEGWLTGLSERIMEEKNEELHGSIKSIIKLILAHNISTIY